MQGDPRRERLRQVFRGQSLLSPARGHHLRRPKQQDVGEDRHDLFDMMRHENQRRPARLASKALKELKKMLTRGWVEPRARFVED